MNRLLPSGPLMEHPMPGMGRLGKPGWRGAGRESFEVKGAENKFSLIFLEASESFEDSRFVGGSRDPTFETTTMIS